MCVCLLVKKISCIPHGRFNQQRQVWLPGERVAIDVARRGRLKGSAWASDGRWEMGKKPLSHQNMSQNGIVLRVV